MQFIIAMLCTSTMDNAVIAKCYGITSMILMVLASKLPLILTVLCIKVMLNTYLGISTYLHFLRLIWPYLLVH